MASAVAPDLNVVAIHDARNLTESGVRATIEAAVALDAQGAEYDVAVADSSASGKILRRRALAAKLLERSKEAMGLSIHLEKAIATGTVEDHPVTITRHLEGSSIPFENLTLAQCAALGTSIASIHLLSTDFLLDAGYPRFTAESIRADLTAWVKRLHDSPEVPQAIVKRWEQLAGIDALWQFTPRTIHGDFFPNDILFRDDSVRAVRYWENIQVSDPARDFAWAYEDWISDQQRDAVLSAYGRMMGSRMDARIVPRARLWRQMDLVRELLRALDAADRAWIRSARERVERLAGILNPVIPVTPKKNVPASAHDEASSTITVGTLLSESGDNGAAKDLAGTANHPVSPEAPSPSARPARPTSSTDDAPTELSQPTAAQSAAAQSAAPQHKDGTSADVVFEDAAAEHAASHSEPLSRPTRPTSWPQKPAPEPEAIYVPSERNDEVNGTDGNTVDPELDAMRGAETETFDRSNGSASASDPQSLQELQGSASKPLNAKPGYVSLDDDDKNSPSTPASSENE
jgi:hypothetical protein